MELAEFVKARLDEDEAAARGAYYEGQRWITEEEGVYRYPADEVVHYADREADARHIALWDPARVLREVEAKRAILAEHEPQPWGQPHPDLSRCPAHGDETTGWWTAWPCVEVRALAAVWRDHPDFRPEWLPAVAATTPEGSAAPG